MCCIDHEALSDLMYSSCHFQSATGHWLPHPSDMANITTASPKRKASSPMGREPAKRSKGSESDNVAAGDEEAMESLKQQLAEQAAETERFKGYLVEMERVKSELDEAEEDRAKMRAELAEFQAAEEKHQLGWKAEEAERKAKNATIAKNIEESIKQKWEQKLQAQKQEADSRVETWRGKVNHRVAELKERHRDEMHAKDAAHKKNKEELTAKHTEQQKAKDDATSNKIMENDKKMAHNLASCKKLEAGAKAFAKKTKEEHVQLAKELRAEQKAEINKWKPEHSATLKEKNAALREKQAEIKKLQERYGKSQEESKKFETSFHAVEERKVALETIETELKEEIVQLHNEFRVSGEQMETLVHIYEEEKKSFENRLEFEGRKWQIQYDNAQQAVRNAVHHQRACFDLKNANARRDGWIKELNGENQTLKAELEAAKTEVTRLSVDVVAEPKDEGEMGMTDEGAEFVDAVDEQHTKPNVSAAEQQTGLVGQ